jgi:hypothetical protein
MAIAMTVGATRIQILQQNCLAAVGHSEPQEEEELSAEAPPEEQACGT